MQTDDELQTISAKSKILATYESLRPLSLYLQHHTLPSSTRQLEQTGNIAQLAAERYASSLVALYSLRAHIMTTIARRGQPCTHVNCNI